jgi:hypothetical protein
MLLQLHPGVMDAGAGWGTAAAALLLLLLLQTYDMFTRAETHPVAAAAAAHHASMMPTVVAHCGPMVWARAGPCWGAHPYNQLQLLLATSSVTRVCKKVLWLLGVAENAQSLTAGPKHCHRCNCLAAYASPRVAC